MKKAWIWMAAAAASMLALEGAARVFTRPWPTMESFGLRIETLCGDPIPGDVPRVLVLGDSIVYGEDVAYADAYPEVLGQMWATTHPAESLAFVNGGVRGLTTLYGVTHLPVLMREFRPGLIVITFGLNDGYLARSCVDARLEAEFMVPPTVSLLRRSRLFVGLERRWRRHTQNCMLWEENLWEPRVSEEAFARALVAMVEQARRQGAEPVLLTTTSLGPGFRAELDEASREAQRQVYARYNNLIRDVAQGTGAALVDVFANLRLAPADWKEDGVHLTQRGYRKLAEYLFAELEPRMRGIAFEQW